MTGTRVMINGLSIGSGGGYTVGREVLRSIAEARPDWAVSMAVIAGHRLQEELRSESLPDNCDLVWAPGQASGRVARARWESGPLVQAVRDGGYGLVFQLNGMIVPGMPVPTLAHFQDPWPYRTEAWTRPVADRLIAGFKRRANRRALREAALCGWTSQYLCDLVCTHHGVTPRTSEVFYNGIPDAWIERARSSMPALEGRPMQLVTISNVNEYKRQRLVITAVAELSRRDATRDVRYRILGQVSPEYKAELERHASSLGIGDRVTVEGRVSDETVTEAFATSRAFVLMSVCESFGIPAIEAMSFGTPAVVSRCCAHPEVCADAAVLVEEDDLQALVSGLESVLTDAAVAGRYRAAGAGNVERFSWSAIGRRMADAIEAITGAPQPAPTG